MANRIVLNETSYHGKGAIQEIAGEVTRRGFRKAFVCSGPTLYKHGVTKKVTDVLEQQDVLMRFIPILKRTRPLRMCRMV